MVRRQHARRLFVASLCVLVFGALAAAITYTAVSMPKLHDVASAARMPIPGKADVKLAARGYGLYYGLRNAPTRVAIHMPTLNIWVEPPKGIAEPEYVSVPRDIDVYVDGFHTLQVSRITVRTPGTYHIRVESPEESGGSLSIGELPRAAMDEESALRLAIVVGLIAFLVSSALMVLAVVARRTEASTPT